MMSLKQEHFINLQVQVQNAYTVGRFCACTGSSRKFNIQGILTCSSRWQRRELDVFSLVVGCPWRWDNKALREILKWTKKVHETTWLQIKAMARMTVDLQNNIFSLFLYQVQVSTSVTFNIIDTLSLLLDFYDVNQYYIM